MTEKLFELYDELEELLTLAPEEEVRTTEENEIYVEMQNLQFSIINLLW